MPALKIWLSMLGLAALGQAGASYATEPQAPIIVQGQGLHSQINDFVSQLKPASGNDQLGKFLQPVCPDVAGLSTAQEIAVANRMPSSARRPLDRSSS